MVEANLAIAAVEDDYADICRTVETICEKFPSKYWRDLETAPTGARYPSEFVVALEAAGFSAPLLPEKFGGIGLPLGAVAKVVETIHACGCNAAVLAAQYRLGQLLAAYASQTLRDRVLPPLASGRIRVQGLAVAERDFGADLSLMKTRATQQPSGWSVTGRKHWVYYSENSQFILLAARTGDDADDVSLFLVDMDTHRDGSAKIELIESMNNNGGADVAFNNLKLEEGDLVGALNGAREYLEKSQSLESIFAAAAAYGDSRFFCRKGVDYAKERVVFGNPIGKYQGIQFPLARAYVESQGGQILLRMAIALFEAGRDCRDEAVMAHHVAVQSAWESAEATFTTHGGFAFAREYDVERKWREVRAARNSALFALPQIAEHML